MIALPMAAAERAERMTGRQHLSFSSISTYQACPLRWYFRYVEKLPEGTRSASLAFGSAIHGALQRHYDGLLIDGVPPTSADLLDAYRHAWAEEAGAVRFSKGDDADAMERLAARMLDAFRSSELASPAGTILAVEEELVGDIGADCPPLLARLDLAVENDDAVVVTDFKTAKSRWSFQQAEDSATQLLLYGELARPLGDGKPIQLQFGVLTKTKEPSVDVHPVEADASRVDRMRRIVERVWKAIEAENFYPAPSLMNCPTCPYRAPCRSWPG